MGKIVLRVSVVIKSLASMRITFLVRSRGQRSSNAQMILASSVTTENSWLELCVRFEFFVEFKVMYVF